MGKRYFAWLLGISLLLLCSCKANADKQVEYEVIEGTEEIEEQSIESNEDTMTYALYDETSTRNRLTYSGKTYAWQDVTIIIPAEWKEKYIIKEDEDDLYFFQKASNEKDETMGWLCAISKRSEYMNYGAGEQLIAYTDDGTFYYLTEPTDVTCYLEDEAISEEYGNMMSQVEWIAGSMVVTAENVHYDVNQYEIPVSSVIALEEHHLVNLTDNELWIARNEIYARHGKIFQNEYLTSYFNSCSWYQAKEGKTEVGERELNEVEIANLKLIVAAEEAYAKEHPYPKQYLVGEEAEVALQQSTEEVQEVLYEVTVGQDWEHTCILTIDGEEYNLDDYITLFTPVQDVFYVTDISAYDEWLEIAILDDGPSADPVTHFFQYDGKLRYIGEVEGFPFEDYGNNGIDGFSSQNSVMGTGRTDLIETAYVDAYYWYDSSERALEWMERVNAKYTWYKPHELYVDIPVYCSKDENAPTLILQAQEEVFFLETDCKEWILVRGKDGVEGYIRIEDGQVLNISLPAEEVFSELYFFG